MIGNTIAYKITPLGKTKGKENKKRDKKSIHHQKRDKAKGKEKEEDRQEIYISPEKRQQIIDNLRLFSTSYKNGIPKNHKLVRHNA